MNFSFNVSNVFSDNAVLQRGKKIRICGTAPAHSRITVTLGDATASCSAASDGKWLATLPPMEAGGPYSISVSSSSCTNPIIFSNVMIGEVWFCGGQSNMEFPVLGEKFFSLPDGNKVVETANDPLLRLYRIPRCVSLSGECSDAPRGCQWKIGIGSDAIGNFSAIGFLFGQMLRKRLKVPVGLVSSNWGGCRIEPWIAERELREEGYSEEITKLEDMRHISNGEKAESNAAKAAKKAVADGFIRLKQWHKAFKKTANKDADKWASPDADCSTWEPVQDSLDVLGDNVHTISQPGIYWFRISVNTTKTAARVRFEQTNDVAEVYWDGRKIGSKVVSCKNYWEESQEHAVPKSLSAPGAHTIAVRLENHYAWGSITGPSIRFTDGSALFLPFGNSKEPNATNISQWFWKIEFSTPDTFPERPMPPFFLWQPQSRDDFTIPTTLYNSMFAPFAVLHFRGALWYQGCSNADNPAHYVRLQKTLVKSWRRATGDPDMAFLAVQLAGFENHIPTRRLADDYWLRMEPRGTGYAPMREAQTTICRVKGTGIVTACDIGDHSDIHPWNKREVARRLEALAAKKVYGLTDLAVEGPRCTGYKIEGSHIRLFFDNVAKGLRCKGGKSLGTHAFAIATADGPFVWANAILDGDTIVVSSPKIAKPTRVRYAFEPYTPHMRLFNSDGFPAFPFRTDSVFVKPPKRIK